MTHGPDGPVCLVTHLPSHHLRLTPSMYAKSSTLLLRKADHHSISPPDSHSGSPLDDRINIENIGRGSPSPPVALDVHSLET
jgi:hypothetical protein